MLEFSIVTPSYNMLSFLKMCAASIADQQDVSIEHIVIDNLSTDGTVEWLKNNPNIISISEKDKGMYDAINKGFQMAMGNILAYLNCDEQYLPGTLKFVKDYFEDNPDIDVIFGDSLLVKPGGKLLSYRKGYQPRWCYILTSHLYTLSCSMFLRKKIIDDGIYFDHQLKTIGDADFVIRVLRRGYRAAHVRRYLAVFTMTGKNMSIDQNAFFETKRAIEAAPKWVKALKLPLNAARLIEKLISGAYRQKMPLEYSVYPSDKNVVRKNIKVWKASFRWRSE